MRVRGFCHRSPYARLGIAEMTRNVEKKKTGEPGILLRLTVGKVVLEAAELEGRGWERRKKRAPGFCYESRPAIRVGKVPEIEMSRRFDWRKHRY